MSSIKLSYDLKKLVFSYLETPSSYAIKGEINRILPLIEQNKLTESQTLWSIRKIYWHETTNIKKYLFYNHNIDQIAYYDLEIALLLHKSGYSYKDTLSEFEKHLRHNSLLDNLKKKLIIKFKFLRWSEEYYKKLFIVSVLLNK
jgi:hypothetical protein